MDNASWQSFKECVATLWTYGHTIRTESVIMDINSGFVSFSLYCDAIKTYISLLGAAECSSACHAEGHGFESRRRGFGNLAKVA